MKDALSDPDGRNFPRTSGPFPTRPTCPVPPRQHLVVFGQAGSLATQPPGAQNPTSSPRRLLPRKHEPTTNCRTLPSHLPPEATNRCGRASLIKSEVCPRPRSRSPVHTEGHTSTTYEKRAQRENYPSERQHASPGPAFFIFACVGGFVPVPRLDQYLWVCIFVYL